VSATGGIDFSTLGGGGNETLNLAVDLSEAGITGGLLASVITDVTATAAEINATVAGTTATAANLNTLTGGASSDADALHTHPALGGALTITTGEAIDGSATPQACFISAGTVDGDATVLQSQQTENNAEEPVYGVFWFAQTFTTGAYEDTLTRVDLMLKETGNPSGNLRMRIYAVDGSSKPTGAELATVNVTATTVGTTLFWTTFTLASALTVTPSTEYAIVIDVISGDATNMIGWQLGNGDTYANGQPWKSADAGGTWTSPSANDFAFKIWLYEAQTAGLLYQSKSDEAFRGGFDGFVTSNTGSGAAADFRLDGIQGSFAGLTINTPYYVASTLGEITSTITGLKVGKAISATEIEIDKSGGFVELATQTSATLDDASASVIGTEDMTFVCGFKPSRVDLSVYIVASGTNAGSSAFKGDYISNLHGITVPYDAAGSGAANIVSDTASLTGSSSGANRGTITLGTFVLKQSGIGAIASHATVAGTGGNGTVAVKAVCYR